MDKRNHRRNGYKNSPEFGDWRHGPFRMVFSFLWVMFFVLVFLSMIALVLNYIIGIPISWLGNAWGAWGGIWIFLLILFFFMRPWGWMYYWKYNDPRIWRRQGYGDHFDGYALYIARKRLAHGEITVEQYRKIVNELKRK